MTLAAALLEAARSSRGVGFVDRHESLRRLSYAALCDRALRVGAALGAAGVAPGTRVALVARTSPEFYDGFFGALFAGAVPVVTPPPPRLGAPRDYRERTAAMLARAGASALLAQQPLLEACAQVAAAAGIGRCHALEELRGGAPGEPRGGAADDVALIQFSSGSEGPPKAVVLTHRRVLANVDAILAALAPDGSAEQVGVSWLPLHHDMGLVGCLFTGVRKPADLFLIAPEDFAGMPALWLRAIARYRATVSPAPSFAYALAEQRVGDEDLEGLDLSAWANALNGGEPVSAPVMERFAARFARHGFRAAAMRPVYGLSEAGLAVCFPPPGRAPRVLRFDPGALLEGRAVPDPRGAEIVSVGRALPGYSVWVADEDGRRLEEGRIGSIRVRGPSLMEGYLEDPAATARVLREGWLDTGDRGFELDGELFVHGRSKDVIVVNGRKHAPERIETVVEELVGRVGCCAAIGLVPAGAEHEALVLLVERGRRERADDPALADSLRRRVGERTALAPALVVLVPHGSLPRTTSGKIRRGASAQLYQRREFFRTPW